MKPVEARIRNSVSQSFKKLNPQLFGGNPGGEDDEEHAFIEALTKVKPPAKKRIRQSEKPLMNKIETEYFEILKRNPRVRDIRPQAKTYRLGNGLRFTPDITAKGITTDREMAYEVKGKHAWDDSIAKLKAAAAIWTDVVWFLVWKDEQGQWQEQKVLP